MADIFNSLGLSSDTALLLISPHNMLYFSGFSGGEGYVLITKSKGYIIVDSRYTGIAKEEAFNDFEVIEFSLESPFSEIYKNILFENKIRSVAFEEDILTYSVYKRIKSLSCDIEFIEISEKINQKRSIKTDKEIEIISKAEQIGVDAFEHVLKYIKVGVSEHDIAAELEYFMKKNGAEKTAFDTIVLSAERTALPHGMPSDRKFAPGDFVLMDFGCVYNGYCSDMTRTVVVGEADKRQKQIYETVKCAQQAGLDTIRAGITGKEADMAARKVIHSAGFGEYFGHSLGHGVGVLIHEQPNLSPRSEVVLEENMVVSCEPGIYIYGYGGVRIEDLVCVKKDEILNLTHLSKDLIEIY